MKAKIFAVSAIALGLIAGSTQAATGTANVQMLLNITSNTGACTVTPSAASFNLPNGTATQGMQDWMKAAGFTQVSPTVPTVFIAGSLYDQTVNIACAQVNTPITSIQVAPAAANISNGRTGIASLLDDAGNKLAGGTGAETMAELVSITSVSGTQPTPYIFANTNGTRPYTAAFMTSSTLNASSQSTASFVWHPTMWVAANTPLGNPVGGHFIAGWTVTINY